MSRIWFKEQKEKSAHSLNIQPTLDSRIADTLAPHLEYLHWVGWLSQPVSDHLEAHTAQELF